MREKLIAHITLLHGEKVIVDADDLSILSGIEWYLNGLYARGTINHKYVFLHEHLMGKAPKGFHIDHINGNKLDNRRKNLRIIPVSENIRNRRRYFNENNPFFGKTHTPMVRKKISTAQSIPVIQLTMEGVELRVYGSALEAQRITGISNGNINSVIKGKRKSAGGYLWKR